MSLNSIAEQQAGWFTNWFVFRQPLGALIFFIAATAEANRTPFDLTEADSEIVAGFATEYSGMRFGFFFFAEYVNVFIVSALMVTLFFGGWNAPINIDDLSRSSGSSRPRGLDPAGLGIGLLILVAVVPARRARCCSPCRSTWPAAGCTFWQALIIGFLLFNLVAIGGAHRRWPTSASTGSPG